MINLKKKLACIFLSVGANLLCPLSHGRPCMYVYDKSPLIDQSRKEKEDKKVLLKLLLTRVKNRISVVSFGLLFILYQLHDIFEEGFFFL